MDTGQSICPKQIRIGALVFFFALVSGCDQFGQKYSSGISKQSQISNTLLSLSPVIQTVYTGPKPVGITLSASGGTAPYIFTLTSGLGNISGSIYTPPAAQSSTATITVTDATKTVSTGTISVIYQAISVPISKSTLRWNTPQTLTPTGGSGNYTYQLTSGLGSMSGSTFVAPAANTTAQIQISDDVGNTATTTIIVSNTGSLPMSSASSNDVLWSAGAVVDGDAATCYSSTMFPTSQNSRNSSLTAWLAQGSQQVSKLVLTARMIDGVPQGFPGSYDVYITTPDGNTWTLVGTYSNQPDSSGVAISSFGTTYSTSGVMIVPKSLGVDGYGNHYLQMAEVALGN